MGNKIIKNIIKIFIILIGISFITFTLTYLSPGDPAEMMLRSDGAQVSEEVVNKLRTEMGLDKPFFEQYVDWLMRALTGDLGMSYSTKVPVFDKLASTLGSTLELTFASMLFLILISIPLGVLSAVYQNSKLDFLIRGFSFLGVSIPNFWLGLMLLNVFAVKLKWVTVAGGSGLADLILPSLTLAFAMAGKYTRQVRAAVLEEMNKQYVFGARMRGISERTILIKHVLPNAMFPLITLLGLSFGSLLGGTAVIEIVFNRMGMGSMAVKAIMARDYPLVQGYVLWIGLIYLVVNILVDVSYKILDPRLREVRHG